MVRCRGHFRLHAGVFDNFGNLLSPGSGEQEHEKHPDEQHDKLDDIVRDAHFHTRNGHLNVCTQTKNHH